MRIPQITLVDHQPQSFGRLTTGRQVALVSFDRSYIDELNARNRPERYGAHPYYLPAKYALTLDNGPEDINLFAQALFMSDKFMKQAVWFNDLKGLTIALQTLVERHPKENIRNQIDYFYDYPAVSWEVASKMVTPNPPTTSAHSFIDEG